jgi:hypothetical protein
MSNVRWLMNLTLRVLLISAIALVTQSVGAADTKFSGTWSIDLRTPDQRAQNAECGKASFVLRQVGKEITGSHTMATVGCGRLNEGGEGTVKGQVVGNRALLLVTSGRNGATVKGVATLRNNALFWETKEQVEAGEPAGDSPLILGKGSLTKVSK